MPSSIVFSGVSYAFDHSPTPLLRNHVAAPGLVQVVAPGGRDVGDGGGHGRVALSLIGGSVTPPCL